MILASVINEPGCSTSDVVLFKSTVHRERQHRRQEIPPSQPLMNVITTATTARTSSTVRSVKERDHTSSMRSVQPLLFPGHEQKDAAPAIASEVQSQSKEPTAMTAKIVPLMDIPPPHCRSPVHSTSTILKESNIKS